MSDRYEMVRLFEEGWPKSDLADRFGVSWRTVHEWIGRYQAAEGEAGLLERSRRPHSSPTRVSEALAEELIELKRKYPDFGPAKLIELFPGRSAPMAASTAGGILKRAGYVRARRRRRRTVPCGAPLITVPGAGHTMTADHKGQFRLGDRQLCYPLTICDPGSRYILAIDALESTRGELARPVFERVFHEYGLPHQIVTDNGPPFCNVTALGGLSELAKWWIKLGIDVLRIEPGKPQQNGRHERMHRTLKASATRPPSRTMRAQQHRFDAFRKEFNEIRPHEALGQRPPASALAAYGRQMPRRVLDPFYGDDFEVRHVRSNGQVKWKGELVFVSGVLIGETVGFRQNADDTWELYFGPVRLAFWDDRKRLLIGYKRAKNNRGKGISEEGKSI